MMYIKLVCPNGHKLRVQEIHAGRRAVCPRCQAKLLVPRPKAQTISDTSVMAVLGSVPANKSVIVPPERLTQDSTDEQPSASATSAAPARRATRKCAKCQTTMSARIRICPKCQLYQPDLEPVAPPRPQNCPTCGETCPPATIACGGCGAALPAA